MKTFIRYELSTDHAINLRRLSPAMKIYAGVITKVHETKFYKSYLQKHLEKEHMEQMKRDEKLKDFLLALLYRELTANNTLSKKGLTCSSIIVSIDSEYQESLDRVLKHKDFILYDISRVEEEGDIRAAFSNMPILLSVSKKAI